MNISECFISWISSLFVGHLPYQTVLRILDCLLYEGSNVLYRMGLAILSRAKSTLLQTTNSKEFLQTLRTSAIAEVDCNAFLACAFAIKIKNQRLVEIYQSIVERGDLNNIPEMELHIFNPPKVMEPSMIINSEQVCCKF